MKVTAQRLVFCLMTWTLLMSVQAQGFLDTSESRLRAELDLQRLRDGVKYVDTRVVVITPELKAMPEKRFSIPPPLVVDVASANTLRVYTLVPTTVILSPQRFYETTVVSRVTLVDPSLLPLTTNPSPSFGLERPLSSVVVPASSVCNLNIQQITMPFNTRLPVR